MIPYNGQYDIDSIYYTVVVITAEGNRKYKVAKLKWYLDLKVIIKPKQTLFWPVFINSTLVQKILVQTSLSVF